MRPHESIIVGGADNPAFASVMSATVIVDLNARGEGKAADETLAIEQRIKIDPDTAVGGPWAARGNDMSSLGADIVIGRLQVLADTDHSEELFQFLCLTCPTIENA